MTAIHSEATIPLYHSSVAILEAPGQPGGPNILFLEQRPNLVHTDMCNPGVVQLFGGHREPTESAWDALQREIGEETTLPADQIAKSQIYLERGRRLNGILLGVVGWQASRIRPLGEGASEVIHKRFSVALHHVWVPEAFKDFGLSTKEQERGTKVAMLPATPEGIEGAQSQLAVFSLRALQSFVAGTPMQGNMHQELAVAGG